MVRAEQLGSSHAYHTLLSIIRASEVEALQGETLVRCNDLNTWCSSEGLSRQCGQDPVGWRVCLDANDWSDPFEDSAIDIPRGVIEILVGIWNRVAKKDIGDFWLNVIILESTS